MAVGPIPAASHPPTPRSRPSTRAYKLREPTCGNPVSVDCPGFFFVTVKAFSLGSQILPECVSRRPHCSFIRVAAAVDGTDDIAIN